ncbi:MAG: asparagine synthase C-terminal domain-containing protein, partial [Pseudomonadota bacterium]|nr:asparagine synthase C-terminal domain-containing protein [Pseudomonadota bacterium]
NMLRETAAASIGAWAACFDQPMLEISGGLDSAIVAACFTMFDRHPEALTFGPTPGDPDELPYAQAIADRLGVPLKIKILDLVDIDLLKSDARDLPRPCARNFSQALDRQLSRAATSLRVDAFFSGGGGDSLFGHLQSALPAIDRYRREGVGKGLLGTIDDVARLGRVTIWEAVATVLQRWRRATPSYPKYGSNRFVSAAAGQELPWPDHPWTEPAPETLPAKRAHVWAMIGIFNYMEGYDRLIERPIISPLMSQPLFELCMRIPTWLWCQNGIKRAVARKAFEDILPDVVVTRPSKGAFDGFGAALIDQNRIQLKGLLLDGALAREGLIDLTGVDRSLSLPVPDGELIVDLLTLADAEAWVRSWEARS